MYEPKPFKEQLIGYDSEQNAYSVDNYPYGYTLRTTIRYWIETNKTGDQRFCSQTKNPKTGIWNKPKKGTYSSVIVMGLDDNNHVSHEGYHMGTYEDKVDQFISMYKLTDQQKKSMDIARAYARAQKMVTWTVTSGHNMNEPRQTIQEQTDIMKKAAVISYVGMMNNQELTGECVLKPKVI